MRKLLGKRQLQSITQLINGYRYLKETQSPCNYYELLYGISRCTMCEHEKYARETVFNSAFLNILCTGYDRYESARRILK